MAPPSPLPSSYLSVGEPVSCLAWSEGNLVVGTVKGKVRSSCLLLLLLAPQAAIAGGGVLLLLLGPSDQPGLLPPGWLAVAGCGGAGQGGQAARAWQVSPHTRPPAPTTSGLMVSRSTRARLLTGVPGQRWPYTVCCTR